MSRRDDACAPAQRPNIVYLHSHDTGRAVQPYGFPVATPRIQRFAEQGVLLRSAFCGAPTCSGSRACLLTGQPAHVNGMLGLAHRGWSLRDPGQLLVHPLREAGYHSALCGMQHVAEDPGELGYDEVVDVATTHVANVAPAAAALLARPLPEPFFLDVGCFETHRRFFAPASRRAALDCAPIPPLPDTPETRADAAAYAASAESLDGGVGTVLHALEEHGLAERTLVVLTTDHGLPFPHAKATLSDRGTGVMLILRGPGGFTGGRVNDALVTQLDLFPLVLALATGGDAGLPARDAVFTELTYHVAYDPQRAVRTARHKLVRLYGDHLGPVLPNVDDSPSKDVLVAAGWRDQERPREALYDLRLDPGETRNLLDEPAYAGVRAELARRLDGWMADTADPLLLGPVPTPPGAPVVAPDGRSPDDPPA